MPLADIPRAFQQGVGDTLGFVALVIGLGTVIGKLLAESGGAVVVSTALVAALGERRLDWALLLSGFLIGLPVFFQVGLVLLAPVLFTIAAADRPAAAPSRHPARRRPLRRARARAAAPGTAGGNRAARRRHRADAVLFAHRVPARRARVGSARRPARQPTDARGRSWRDCRSVHRRDARRLGLPSLAITLLTILMPVLLMLLAALAQATMADGMVRQWIAVRRESADGDAARDAAGAVHVRPARAASTAARLLQFARGVAAADRQRPARRRRRRRLRPRARDGRRRQGHRAGGGRLRICRRSCSAGSSRRCCGWRSARPP